MRRTFWSIGMVAAGIFLPFGWVGAQERSIDTIAGFGTQVCVEEGQGILQGDALAVVTASPKGDEQRFEATMEDGEVCVDISEAATTVAGTYSYFVEDARGDVRDSGEFTVFPGAPKRFELEAAGGGRKINPGKTTPLIARVFDSYENPIPGRPLAIIPSDEDVVITKLDQETDEHGEARFTVKAEGAVKFTVMDLLTEETATIAFDSTKSAPTTLGRGAVRASLLDEFEGGTEGETPEEPRSGFAERFRVSVLQNGQRKQIIAVNEPVDIQITALDRAGKTAKGYVGSVVVEIEGGTDRSALLPTEPLKFLPSKQGDMLFSLAYMPGTPGAHTLRAFDADDETLEGTVTVQVVQGNRPAQAGAIVIREPVSGAVRSPQVALKGTAPVFRNLLLKDGDRTIAQGASGSDGTFAFTATLDLASATHVLTVEEDPEGIVGEPLRSASVTLTVDTSAPVLTGVMLLPATVMPGQSFTVSATAEAGHRVVASVGSAPEVTLVEGGPASAADGTNAVGNLRVYSAELTAPMDPGSHTVTVIARDNALNETRATQTLTVSLPGLPTVQGVQAFSAGAGVELRWSPVEGATFYRVYFGTDPADLGQRVDAASAQTMLRITGLQGGRMHYFAVTALSADSRESTEKSTVVSAVPQGSLFQVQLLPTVNGARMEWVPPVGVVRVYRIAYGVQAGEYTEERLLPGTVRRADLTDLINGVTYHLSLSALLEDGTLLVDPAEFLVTPGEGGRPGIRLSPPGSSSEDFPAQGGAWEGDVFVGSADTSDFPEEGFHGAPRAPTTPRSGLPLAVTGSLLLLAAGLTVLGERWRRERRLAQAFLATMAERYSSAERSPRSDARAQA